MPKTKLFSSAPVAVPESAECRAALELQTKIEELERQLKELYGRRQPLVDKFTPLVRSSRKLGEFGFEVKTTEAPNPAPPTTKN